MKSKRIPIAISACVVIVGVILRVMAFQNALEKGTPEWVYDIDAIGNALCSSSNYFLAIAICRYLPQIKLLHFIKAVSAGYLFVVCFDAAKEVSGLNTGDSWTEVLIFVCGLILILFFQYHVYRYHTTD